MPDPELNDPVDEVYRQAEAALNDDAARAARRARVLAAAAAEVAPAPRVTARPRRLHPAWMATAAALTLSVIVAVNIPRPISTAPSQPPVPASSDEKITPSPPAPPQAAQPAEAVETPAGVKADAAPIGQAPRAAAPEERASGAIARPTSPARARAAEAIAPAASPPALPLPLPPVPAPVAESPKPAPAPPAPSASTFGATDHAEPSSAKAFDARRASPAGVAPTATAELGERLRTAAAAGRTEEVEALLAQGVPVDAADSEGETALMKSVRAGRPATAGLLRRRGASLDHANTSGETVRALAAAKADPQLDRALSLPR